MPRFRFTMRRMMIAVAIAGIACGGEVMRRRREDFKSRASYHLWQEGHGLGLSERLLRAAIESDRDGKVLYSKLRRDSAAKLASWGLHHSKLRMKYERAARYPWFRVAPDPPEPE